MTSHTMPVLTEEKRQALIACANKLITGSRSDNVAELAQIALTVLEQQGGWISCSDRMPVQYQSNRYVPLTLLLNERTVAQGGFDDGQFWIDGVVVHNVTRWQPMPLPPSTTPQIDNDGWIELVDAEMPVHPDSVVEVKMRNGATDGPREAARFFWYRGNEVRDEMGCDIIAYRLIESDGREG